MTDDIKKIGSVWWEQTRERRVDIMFDIGLRMLYYQKSPVATVMDEEEAIRQTEHMFSGPGWDFRKVGE